jgi:hypothetical protein
MRRLVTAIGLTAVCAVLPWQAQSTTVFWTDFEAGVPVEISGAGERATTEGYSAHGFGEWYFLNETTGNPAASTFLNLAGLPAHSFVQVAFDLAIIDSWDGSTPVGGTASPDFFNVRLDGVTVFSETFDNFLITDQTFTGTPIVYGESLARNGGWPDSAYAISLLLPHTSSSLTLEWFASGGGWQGGIDESWAIDNIQVSLPRQPTGVPEGGSTLLLLGIATMGLLGLNRKQAAP